MTILTPSLSPIVQYNEEEDDDDNRNSETSHTEQPYFADISPNVTPLLPLTESPELAFAPFPSPTTTPSPSTTDALNVLPSSINYLYITDYWERLCNVHSALRTMLAISILSNVTLVEPFMYESMVLKKLCTPLAFRRSGLSPQPVSKYLNVSHFTETRHFIPYQLFAQAVATPVADDAIVVTAAVHFLWDNTNDVGVPPVNAENRAKAPLFFPCDDAFRKVPYNRTSLGWAVADGLYARHAVCMDGRGEWMRSATLPDLLTELFRTVRSLDAAGASGSAVDKMARDSVSVATINYRKYITERFNPGPEPLPTIKPAPPSAFGIRIASHVISQHFQMQPFVVMQFRTGRTMASLRKSAFPGRAWENKLALDASNAINRVFSDWVFSCADILIDKAIAQASELQASRNSSNSQTAQQAGVGFYLASDIFNDGWKNGEYETEATRGVLTNVEKRFQERLGRVVRFDPDAHAEITQDTMGLSAVADISVAYLAHAFVSHQTSTVGRHIADIRTQWRDADSVLCDCPAPPDDALKGIGNN